MPKDAEPFELQFFTFVPKDYTHLRLRHNPFPPIPLCDLNSSDPLYGETMNQNVDLVYQRICEIFQSNACKNIFIDRCLGTGKTTFLLALARRLNTSGHCLSVFTRYPPGGLQKLYHYCLSWVGFKKFASAYIAGRDNRWVWKLLNSYFLSKVYYFVEDPERAFDSLYRTRNCDTMSLILASLMELLRVCGGREYSVLIIDNIEHMWSYISPYQKRCFMIFLSSFLSRSKGRSMVIMPIPSNMEIDCESYFPPICKLLDFSNERVFSLRSKETNCTLEIIRSYLRNANEKLQNGYHPFTEEAIEQISNFNKGLISGILLDAFNLIEMACREKVDIIDADFVRKYYTRFLESSE